MVPPRTASGAHQIQALEENKDTEGQLPDATLMPRGVLSHGCAARISPPSAYLWDMALVWDCSHIVN